MNLKLLLPTEILVDEKVSRIIAEAENGSFCILPRHIDFVAALVPGLFSFESLSKGEEFLAVDEGILVKCGHEVLVSARNAVRGPDLGMLKETVQKQFSVLDEQQKKSKAAMASLESNLVRKFIELGKKV